MVDCIFCKLAKNGDKIYEDDRCYALFDINPIVNGHTLLIPKKHIDTFFEADDNTLKALCAAAKQVKKKLDKLFAPSGYNIKINVGKVAGQEIMHLHFHIVPCYNSTKQHTPKGL